MPRLRWGRAKRTMRRAATAKEPEGKTRHSVYCLIRVRFVKAGVIFMGIKRNYEISEGKPTAAGPVLPFVTPVAGWSDYELVIKASRASL